MVCLSRVLRPFAFTLGAAALVAAGSFAHQSAHAQTYSTAEAAYVTNSTDPAVIAYVLCLESAVGSRPRREALNDSITFGINQCSFLTPQLTGANNQPTAQIIQDKVRACGFRPADSGNDPSCNAVAGGGGIPQPGGGGVPGNPTGPSGNPGINPGGNPVRVADSIVSTPREISVGKWPLGMVHDGNQLWVAESGQRTIAAIDFDTGQIIERKRVGRLPTSMARSDDGTVFTLVATDQLIRRFSPGGRERVLPRLGTCPEEMIFADGNVWAMTLPQCSSESSQIVRIDPQTGRQSRSAVLGEWGQAMTAYGGEIFVFHTRSPELTVVDMGSMNHTTYSVPGLSFWSAAQNASRVFGGGRVQRTKDEGLVLAFDPVSRQETARASVSERVVQLHANDQHLVALGSQGTMWVFDEATLELKRTITPSTGVYSPRVMLEHDGFLLVSSYAEPSGQGSIFVFDNWEPAGLNGDPGDPGVPGNPGANPNARAFPVGAGSWGGNVRNGPGTTFSLVTSLAQGEPVTLLSETTVIFNGYPWFEIQFRGGQTGYQWGGILCGTERPVSGIYQMCTGSPTADGQGNN